MNYEFSGQATFGAFHSVTGYACRVALGTETDSLAHS